MCGKLDASTATTAALPRNATNGGDLTQDTMCGEPKSAVNGVLELIADGNDEQRVQQRAAAQRNALQSLTMFQRRALLAPHHIGVEQLMQSAVKETIQR